MTRQQVSAWYRQVKHRASHNYDVTGVLTLWEVMGVLEHFNSKCAFCGEEATTLDLPFPLADSLLFVQANILPCCDGCKRAKGNKDLVKMWEEGELDTDRYIDLVRQLLTFRGQEELRKWMKMLTGL